MGYHTRRFTSLKDGFKEILSNGPPKDLEIYVNEKTKNPYVAQMLVRTSINQKIRNTNNGRTISLEQAISHIDDNGLEGVVKVWNSLNSAIISGPGGSKGNYYVGEYDEICEFGMLFRNQYGFSIGTTNGTAHNARYNKIKNIDLSTNSNKQLADDLTKTLYDGLKPLYDELEFLEKEGLPLIKGLAESDSLILASLKSGLFKHNREVLHRMVNFNKKIDEMVERKAILDSSGFSKVMRNKYGDKKLNEFKGLHIYTTDLKSGELYELNSENEFKDLPISKAILMSTAIPFLLSYIPYKNKIFVDGGIHPIPINDIFNHGEDIVLATILNYYPHPKEQGGLKGFILKFTDTMQYVNTKESFRDETGQSLKDKANDGHITGKELIMLPDLSYVNPIEFDGECYELYEKSREYTKGNLSKFLAPDFAPDFYDPKIFMKQYKDEIAKIRKAT